jgi:hypothetical protein
MSVLLNTTCVPADLRPYLPLYLEVILESPIVRNGGNDYVIDVVRVVEFWSVTH